MLLLEIRGIRSRLKRDKYIELVKNISENIKQNIFFTGYIDYSDMPNYYAIADIVVIPSIWEEPCSLTLFEAMASSKKHY